MVYESGAHSFTTADYSNKFMFVVMGDNRPGLSEGLLNGIMNNNPRFVLHTGDLVQNGHTLSDWFIFFRNWESMLSTIPTMSVYGNHEEFVLLNEFFVFPGGNAPKPDNEGQWYSFQYNNVHIVNLYNYDDFSPVSDQYNWLINDLENVSEEVDHVFAHIHAPMFTSGVRQGAGVCPRTYKNFHHYLISFFC